MDRQSAGNARATVERENRCGGFVCFGQRAGDQVLGVRPSRLVRGPVVLGPEDTTRQERQERPVDCLTGRHPWGW